MATEASGGQLHELSAEDMVRLALTNRSAGLAWTYNEPTIWLEYSIDGAKLAKKHGLYTVYVTNGYITPEALDAIGPYLDAFRVDIKGWNRSSTVSWPRCSILAPDWKLPLERSTGGVATLRL